MVRFETTDPSALLQRIRSAIDAGRIVTWSYDKDGDFTHTRDQWMNRAWLRPSKETNKLSFFIVPPKGEEISRVIYAVYHGRFIESVLSHCDDAFTYAVATAFPEGADRVKGT
jgi:hypothetical protein